MLKVIVAGGRDFENYNLLAEKLDILFSKTADVVIVSGMAKGVDSLAVKYAEENKLRVSEFPANWNKFGNASGFRRNVEIARFADACVCFWDGKSAGTKHMIDTAKRMNLKLRVINY
jgi:predicted Rossmann fold nucleotide-binding protein DprA/Smf involved in DNA uptake